MSDYPPVLVTAYYNHEHVKGKEDILEQPSVPKLIDGPHHLLTGATYDAIALFSARNCVEPKSYRIALSSAQALDKYAAMQHE
jgi:hypothetical protein